MKNLETPSPLDPRRFTYSIRRHPDFLKSLPTKERFGQLPEEERHTQLRRAMAAGALSLSQESEKERGEYDLDANLYRLVSQLQGFYEGSQTLETLGEQYGSPRQMPADKKRQFYNGKHGVIDFNHTLHEVINAGASKFDFNSLLVFMTNMYTATNGPENTRGFHDKARQALIGIRNEMAVEQLLIAGGVEYEVADAEQDATGGDFIVEGVPIDVKASQMAANIAREKAARNGYNPHTIIWSHIDFADFEGKLTLPYERSDELFAKLKPGLDAAIASQRGQQTA